MIWEPSLGFYPYCDGKLLPFTKLIYLKYKFKKSFFYKSYDQISKIKQFNFLEIDLNDLDRKIYMIEGTKEVMQTI